MANYVARIELHNATYDDYETLHAAAGRRGFLRIIAADNGGKYQLPTGTYVAEKTNATLEQAYDAARAAAAETRKSILGRRCGLGFGQIHVAAGCVNLRRKLRDSVHGRYVPLRRDCGGVLLSPNANGPGNLRDRCDSR